MIESVKNRLEVCRGVRDCEGEEDSVATSEAVDWL